MILSEQIAHDLTMVYLNNKYGVDVNGDFSINSNSDLINDNITEISGSGSVETTHFYDVDTPKYEKVKTGEKYFFGMEKKIKVQSGYVVDDVFNNMIEDYYKAYARFLEILEKKQQ